VRELRVPAPVGRPFQEQFRALLLGSLLRAAEEQAALYRAEGRHRRARHAEQTARRVRGLTGAAVELLPEHAVDRWFGPKVRVAVRVAWLVAAGLLAFDVARPGRDSWLTGATDFGLMALTVIWFFVSVADLGEQPPAQLTLFR
jgi:hypothetical protein